MSPDTYIRVLIAEDEPIILQNIAKKTAKAGDWIQIAGMAESGSEALVLLEENPADILITDIEMPGMNGLELIRTVRERFPQMKLIILSGYSNFEYARTALRYGVNDYLLKPVSQETITELLHKLGGQIAEENTSRRREILSLTLNGKASPSDLPSAFTEGCFYLLHLTIGNYAGQFAMPEVSSEYLSIWDEFVLDECLEGIPGLAHAWMIDESYSLCKFIILYSEKEQASLGRLRLLMEHYCREKLRNYPFLLLLYPGPITCEQIRDTAKKLRQAALLYSRPFQQEAWFSDEIAGNRPGDTSVLTQAVSMLRGISGTEAFLLLVRRTLTEFIDKQYPSYILLKFVSEAFNAAQSDFFTEPERCRSATADIFGEFYACPDEAAFSETVTEHFRELLEQSSISLPGENLCGKITQYIGRHYCTRLSLNDLSEHFGYTSSYINRIFKKELGISPLQYITNLKIEKAKELLLKEPPLDIRAAASAIGYEDARYFSRVFKNETGMTPTAFIGLHHPVI